MEKKYKVRFYTNKKKKVVKACQRVLLEKMVAMFLRRFIQLTYLSFINCYHRQDKNAPASRGADYYRAMSRQ